MLNLLIILKSINSVNFLIFFCTKKLTISIVRLWIIWMVVVDGLEPSTSSLSEKRSNQLSYTTITVGVVPESGLEPLTKGFSGLCSTNWATLARVISGTRDSNSRPRGPKPRALAIWASSRRNLLSIEINF